MYFNLKWKSVTYSNVLVERNNFTEFFHQFAIFNSASPFLPYFMYKEAFITFSNLFEFPLFVEVDILVNQHWSWDQCILAVRQRDYFERKTIELV